MATRIAQLFAPLAVLALLAGATEAAQAQTPGLTKQQGELRAKRCQATYGKADRSSDLFLKAGICMRDCMAYAMYGNAHTRKTCSEAYELYQVSLAATLAGTPLPYSGPPTRGMRTP